MQTELSTFVLKFARFRCHGNRGSMSANYDCHLQAGRPQNPTGCKYLGCMYYVRQVIQFCIKIWKFSLPWQQNRSDQICLTPLNVPTLITP